MTDPGLHVQNIRSTMIVNGLDEGAGGDEVEEEDGDKEEDEETKRLLLAILSMTEEILITPIIAKVILKKITKPPN